MHDNGEFLSFSGFSLAPLLLSRFERSSRRLMTAWRLPRRYAVGRISDFIDTVTIGTDTRSELL